MSPTEPPRRPTLPETAAISEPSRRGRALAASCRGLGAALAVLVAGGLLPSACGGEALQVHQRRSTLPRLPQGPEPQSSEWLYATTDVRGGRKAECAAVRQLVEGEQECQGALCSHSARLARDWVHVCGGEQPQDKAAVESLAQALEGRSVASGAKCEDETQALIRAGCLGSGDCAEQAQGWATRCGESHGTGLIAKMVALKVARKLGQPSIELDLRSCDVLRAEVAGSLGCGDEIACGKAREGVQLYRQRCVEDGAPVDAGFALLEHALALGAGEEPGPVAVSSARLDGKPAAGLALAESSGVVHTVGEQRVGSASGFLAALSASDEWQEVGISKIFPGKGFFELRYGVLDSPDSEVFRARHPALGVEGEGAQREAARVSALTSELEAAIAVGSDSSQAIGRLRRALEAHSDLLLRSEAAKRVVRERDARLVGLLEALGSRKDRKLRGLARVAELVVGSRRALRLALADVSAEGEVELGASGRAAAVGIEVLAPAAFRAYREAQSRSRRNAEARSLKESKEEDLTRAAIALVEACKAPRAAVAAARESLERCYFGLDSCDEDATESRGERLDSLIAEVASTRTSAVVAGATLSDDNHQQLSTYIDKLCAP